MVITRMATVEKVTMVSVIRKIIMPKKKVTRFKKRKNQGSKGDNKVKKGENGA